MVWDIFLPSFGCPDSITSQLLLHTQLLAVRALQEAKKSLTEYTHCHATLCYQSYSDPNFKTQLCISYWEENYVYPSQSEDRQLKPMSQENQRGCLVQLARRLGLVWNFMSCCQIYNDTSGYRVWSAIFDPIKYSGTSFSTLNVHFFSFRIKFFPDDTKARVIPLTHTGFSHLLYSQWSDCRFKSV